MPSLGYHFWQKVEISADHGDGTFRAVVLNDGRSLESVPLDNLRNILTFRPAAAEALTRIFDFFASDGQIQKDVFRGMIYCTACGRIAELLSEHREGTYVKIDDFLDFWLRQRDGDIAVETELTRLFHRMDVIDSFNPMRVVTVRLGTS